MSFLFRRSSTTTAAAEEEGPRPVQLISVGKSHYIGKMLKKGHWRQNWTERHFVVRGSTMSYYATAEDAKALERPKGVHIVTGVRDEQPNTLTWILDTAEDKSFELRASSMGEKTRFMERMRKAADTQKRRRSLQPTGHPRTDVDEKLSAAVELGMNGYIEQALAVLIELEEVNKDNPEILYHLGTCRLVEGRELLAVEALSEAATLTESTNTPLYCDVMNNIGLAHFILGNYTAAKNCIRSALVHRPKDENIISNLASVHIECKDYAGAEALLKELVKASAPCENTMLNWAEILKATERVPAAVDTLKRLVSVHPNCHPAYNMLGELYEKEGLATLAISAYESACSLQDHRINYHDALRRVRLHVADDEGTSYSAGHHGQHVGTS